MAGIVLCAAGFWMVRSTSSSHRTFLIGAGGCGMVTDIVEPAAGAAKGSVLLVHGLAVNKKIMSYLAGGFTEQGLRVYVPDLPGHGRTAGPFSPQRAEACSESLLRELIVRGLVEPTRTILAGHSMGGAIAVRVANRVPVAGVIAVSPAPMRANHGVQPEALLLKDPVSAPPNSLIISGGWELESMRGNAADLAASRADGTSKYFLVSKATHASLLFSPSVVRASQEWAAAVLHLAEPAAMPPLRGAAGAVAGFFGLLLLAGPFLREALSRKELAEAPTEIPVPPGKARLVLEVAVVALATVGILRLWVPLQGVHLFEGDYFASFLLILGIALLVLHRKSLGEMFGYKMAVPQSAMSRLALLLAACLAAFVLHLLVTGWFDLSLTEAWLNAPRWARFPALLAAMLPYHLAEELVLGPPHFASGRQRLIFALFLRLLAWGAIAAGIFFLHSGEILLVLLAPYFAVLCLLQRHGMDIVRKETTSPAAAALFGAILLAGLCLVIFPVT